MNNLLAVLVLAAFTTSAWCASRTVSLSMPTMDCPVCPITVKTALSKLEGVSKTEVNFDKRQAIVTFDDAKTSVESLTRATKNAGYPSTLVGDTP